MYNVGDENKTVLEIAQIVKEVVGNVVMEVMPTNDPRSYHVCSDKIRNELGFELQHTIRESIVELRDATTLDFVVFSGEMILREVTASVV